MCICSDMCIYRERLMCIYIHTYNLKWKFSESISVSMSKDLFPFTRLRTKGQECGNGRGCKQGGREHPSPS